MYARAKLVSNKTAKRNMLLRSNVFDITATFLMSFCEAGGEAMLEVSFGFFWGGEASVSGFSSCLRGQDVRRYLGGFRLANCWLVVSE